MDLKSIVEVFEREFSSKNALEHVYEISRYHRIQGSQGLIDAGNYIFKQVKGYGLSVRKVMFRFDGVSEFFGFTTPLGWDIRDAWLKIVKPHEKFISTFKEVPTMVIAHSPGTRGEVFEGEVVYVGSWKPGIFRKVNVEGKFVLVSERPYNVFVEAAKAGAKGVIVFRRNSPEPNAVPYFGLFLTRKEVRKYSKTIALSVSERVANEMISAIERGRRVVVQAFVDAEHRVKQGFSIVADVEGERKEYVGFIAHYCHPSPGANDNASGSATLIEMARTIKAIYERGELNRGELGFKFIWVPEYTGTLAILAKEPRVIGEIGFLINLDMVGESQEKTGSVFNIIKSPLVLPYFGNELAEYVADTVFRKEQTFSGSTRTPKIRYASTEYSVGSDHDVFCFATKPSIMLNQWPDKYYHTHMDTPDKVDPEMLKMSGVMALTLGYTVSLKDPPRSIVEIVYSYLMRNYYEKLATIISHAEADVLKNIFSKHYLNYALSSLESLCKRWSNLCERVRKVEKDVSKKIKYRDVKVKVSKKLGDKMLKLKVKQMFSMRKALTKQPKLAMKLAKLMEKNRALFSIIYNTVVALNIRPWTYRELYELMVSEYGWFEEKDYARTIQALAKLGLIEIS